MWIAFKIVFLLMIPNAVRLIHNELLVVNCFQNCIFTYDSQQFINTHKVKNSCEMLSKLYFYLWFPTGKENKNKHFSCELLSKLYFYLWFPTQKFQQLNQLPLWIAFKIVFLLMIPNINYSNHFLGRLWIAFKIVFLLMIPNIWPPTVV